MGKGQWPDKDAQWKPGQSGNPKGRPPKLVSQITKELKEEGFARVAPTEIREVYEFLLGLSREKLEELAENEDTPIIIQVTAIKLLSAKGNEMIYEMLDRSHGKSTQKTEVTGEGGKDLFSSMTDDDIKKAIEKAKST